MYNKWIALTAPHEISGQIGAYLKCSIAVETQQDTPKLNTYNVPETKYSFFNTLK